MPRRVSEIPNTKLTAGRIALIYFILGAAWILLSSGWLTRIASAPESLVLFETFKGLGFVLVTALLLWFLCRSWSRQIAEALARYRHSQSQYELYVKNSPISISVIDRQGNFHEVNRATEELTGYSADELKTIDIFELDVTDDREGTEKAFGEIFREARASRDRQIRRKDGSVALVRVDGVRHTEDRALCFSRDITDRVRNEQRLLMLNAMLRAIRRVNKTIVGTGDIPELIRKICDILVEDREFRRAWIALLDERHKPLHYYNAPQGRPDKLRTFLESGRLPRCLEGAKREDGLIIAARPAEQCPELPIEEELEGCALLGMEFGCDGGTGYIALVANPTVVDDEEEIDLFREVVEDLRFALHTIKVEGEKIRATEDLIAAKKAAENANRAKDEFLAVMSHELRTPLNPIMGHASLLLEELNDTPQAESLEEINRSGERLLKLIDDILFFSQLQKGSKTIKSSHFRILECCQSRLDHFRRRYPEKAIVFTNGYGGFDPVEADTIVAGDVELFERIVDELLSNACKYSHDGGIDLRVGAEDLEPGRFTLRIEVEDNGIGIEEEVLDRLFDPFMQVDSSHTRRYEGIGLGLAICRKIADALNGSLVAESRPGVGSCFRFQCELESVAEPPPKTTARQRTPSPDDGANKPRILVVEDNESNARVAETMLRRCGLSVDLAPDGEAAVRKCLEGTYDLVLMDLSMPVMNGFDATREIRANGSPNRETPILGLSAHVGAEVKRDCLAAGMTGFVPKPIRLESLKSGIEPFVSLNPN